MCTICEPKRIGWGVVVSLALLATAVLVVLEFRAVSHRRQLYTIMNTYLPVSCVPDENNEGKLIHVDCPLEQLDWLSPSVGFSSNLKASQAVFLEQHVEMFQWVRQMGMLGPYYDGQFSSDLVESPSSIFYDKYKNPTFFPNIPGQGRKYTTSIYAGKFSVPEPSFKLAFKKIHQLSLEEDGIYTAPTSPPLYVDSTNTQLYDNALYSGDPHNPQIGDIRVTFWASSATHSSVMGKQTATVLDDFIVGYPNPDNRNNTVLMYAEGDYNPDQVLAYWLRQSDGEPSLIWSLRITVLVLVWCSIAGCCCCCFDTNKPLTTVVFSSGALALSAVCLLEGALWILCSVRAGAALFVGAAASLILAITIWLLSQADTRPTTATTSLLNNNNNRGAGGGGGKYCNGLGGGGATKVAGYPRGHATAASLQVALAPVASSPRATAAAGVTVELPTATSGNVVRWSTAPAWKPEQSPAARPFRS
eukprot:GHVS01052537.1.p1 GENE.GHVS01052537.1~~GHVS01052537.1.p1  ORF type:complete len:475 (-),score=74.05 GHVS01052537.1:546-1970(-)